MSRPLDGIRVIELTTAWAGPMAGRILAWLGADVTHVESPTRTNSWRQNKGEPSPVCYPDLDPGARKYDRTFLFNSQNLNKRSLVIDLKTPEGLAAVRALICASDVLLCNFRGGMLKRLGLDHATLSRDNPGLIVVEMPAYGLSGPHAGYAALGPTMEMAAGMSAMISYPGGKPTVTGPSYMDPVGGFNAASAVLTALVSRNATGLGQHVEVPQVEAAMQLIGPELLAAAEQGSEPAPDGNRVAHACPHDCYPTTGEDEWIAIAVETDAQWQALAQHMQRPDLAEDASLSRLAGRQAAVEQIDRALADWTRGQDKHVLAAQLQASGIPAAPVNTPRDLAASPYLAARGFFSTVTHPLAGTHPYPGLPFHIGPAPADRPAPCFGADNAHLLGEVLGMDAATIARLHAARVIADTPDAEA